MNPERIPIRIFRDFNDASCSIASRIAQLIRDPVVAGDLSNPHGTHRLCLEAFLSALESYNSSAGHTNVWLSRGAWEEWPLEQIEMAEPLSPDELRKKRYGIFRHQRQKDHTMFPGLSDTREFWKSAEVRNMATAARYDKLGLLEYHAIESFVRWPIQQKAQLHKQLAIPEKF